MTGTWKEETPTYSKYGDKRRRQTRKHTIKDKFKPLIKKFHYKSIVDKSGTYKDIIGRYTYLENDEAIKHSDRIDIYTVKLIRKPENGLSFNKTKSIRCAYFHKNKWCDFYTDEIIKGDFECTILKFQFSTFIHYNPPKIISKKYYKTSYSRRKSSIWFYDKPVDVNWHNKYGFWRSNLRKFFQTIANRRDRRYVKFYCHSQEWDKEIKRCKSSKSIDWDVW